MDNRNNIIFNGELSKISKNILAKEIFKITLIASTIPFILISALIIIFSLSLGYIYLIFLFMPIVLYIGCLLTPFISLESTREVSIQAEVIYIKYGKYEAIRNISDIKTIIDFGQGFYFKFKFPHKCIYCFCQKDLIVSGSIEEFENIFKNKIVRKIKN